MGARWGEVGRKRAGRLWKTNHQRKGNKTRVCVVLTGTEEKSREIKGTDHAVCWEMKQSHGKNR